jgi:hypothetical protein
MRLSFPFFHYSFESPKLSEIATKWEHISFSKIYEKSQSFLSSTPSYIYKFDSDQIQAYIFYVTVMIFIKTGA